MKTLERKYSKTDRIIAKAQFSAWVYLASVLLAVLLGGIIAVLWVFMPKINEAAGKAILTDAIMRWVLLGAGIAVLISFLMQALSLYSKELIVTEDKIVYRSGLLSVQNTIIPIMEIRIIEAHQTLLQRIFNMGTISIISDAEKPYKIKGVKAAERFTRRVMKQAAISKQEYESRRVQLQLAGYSHKRK